MIQKFGKPCISYMRIVLNRLQYGSLYYGSDYILTILGAVFLSDPTKGCPLCPGYGMPRLQPLRREGRPTGSQSSVHAGPASGFLHGSFGVYVSTVWVLGVPGIGFRGIMGGFHELACRDFFWGPQLLDLPHVKVAVSVVMYICGSGFLDSASPMFGVWEPPRRFLQSPPAPQSRGPCTGSLGAPIPKHARIITDIIGASLCLIFLYFNEWA